MRTTLSDSTPSIGATAAELDRGVAGLDQASDDLGYETAQLLLRGGARARALTPAHRSAIDRRPFGARPSGGMVDYGRGARAFTHRRALGEHPMRRVEQAQIGFAAIAVTALLTALVVVGLISLAHVRAGEWGGGPGGSVPAMVQDSGAPGGGDPR
ncbi:hypothetical protein LTT66_24460 [Nocardia gipuzkoensis]|uniref:hypothetical protein n=1 Tax=Nocardia gipuzkoensis TaxID=2749991 RepID=UPI001E359311|nr:hypothetical protein [Nocardia gipuzkoensis]UGT66418.1 hypothetical protein LTT66_24460 [Nocardia gipuzkoensis]